MKKTFYLIAALAALVSCQSLKEEWQPVLQDPQESYDDFTLYSEADLPGFGGTFTTIQELKAMYKSGGREILEDIWIKGQVVSSDKTGNIYREMYIQDETGGIDVKIGKSSLYSDYRLGQWIYVYCNGLTLGAYNGMPQLGVEPDATTTNEYETSYMDVSAIINQHVFRGAYADPLSPLVVTEADIKAAITAGFTGALWGKLVTVENLVYGNEIFALLYPHSILPHTKNDPYNRVFLSDAGTWGIDTWAMSKAKYIEYIQSGAWDSAVVGSGNTKYGAITTTPMDYASQMGEKVIQSFGSDATLTFKEIMVKYATANYVSHYFKCGSTDIQVRTSGYSKFSDEKLDDAILSGSPVSITGILSIYNGAAQFSLVDEPSVSVSVE